ncbi:hypothetical protein [Vibrio gallaecicus]|uniref:hypothetical protein n=1 Tax=Vibrio gallaecicus TaxID=552386 RepID=UPI0025B4F69C|nr:hypothetical protein [Vibrio gallaecicus]MDN3617476.1 hypothetical protein [Vibrio gallaecicus]
MIPNAWQFSFHRGFCVYGGMVGFRGSVAHTLMRRYVLRRKLGNWCNYKLGSNPDRERRLMWKY